MLLNLLATVDLTTLAGQAGDVISAAPNGEKLANTIRDFVAPIFLLAIGLVALTFLVQRQVTQFLQFFAIAVGVGVFFYFPGFIEGLAKVLSNALS